MKKLLATSALILATTAPSFAQTTPSPYLEGVADSVRGSNFIGKRVYLTEADTPNLTDNAFADPDANWQDAGEINDILISLSGDTQAVLVDFGGFLGIGEKTVALNMNDLVLVPDSDSADDYFIVFKGSSAELQAAPAYNPDMVFEAATTTATDGAMATDGTAVATDTMAGEMVDLTAWSEADLVGKRVYGPNDEDVGEISAVSMAADGKIAGAIVDVGGFLGIGEKKVALTSDMITLVKAADGDRFIVNATQKQLEDMAPFAG